MWSSDILQGKNQLKRLAYVLIESSDSDVDEDFLMKKIDSLAPEILEQLVHVLSYGSCDYASDDAGKKLSKMKRKDFERWITIADRHADEGFVAASGTGSSHLDLVDSLYWYEKKYGSELSHHQERCLIWATAAALLVHSTWRLDEMEYKKIIVGQNKDGSLCTNKYFQIVTSSKFLSFVLDFEHEPKELYAAIQKADNLEPSDIKRHLPASCQ